MADSTISALTALTGTNVATGDLFEIADVSAGPASKKITVDELKIALGIPRAWCRVYMDSDVTISNSTVTTISWTVEASDPQSIMTVPQAYVVVPTGMTECWVEAQISWDGNPSGDRMARIDRYNSSDVLQETYGERYGTGAAAAATRFTVGSVGWFAVTATERIKVNCYQTSGGNLALKGSSTATNPRAQAFFMFR